MIRSLAHVAVRVSNLDAALEFYCGKLGLEEAFRLSSPEGKPWLVYLKVGGGTFIELFPGGDPASRASDNAVGPCHFCIEVDDVAATAAGWNAQGVETLSGPSIGADNSVQAWFADPDGNRFEIHQYLANSKQAAALR